MQIKSLQTDIEQRLATAEPDVEVLAACEDAGRERVRLFIPTIRTGSTWLSASA